MANLLLVEDDASVRQIVMLQLSLVGYDVRAAEDAGQARRMMEEKTPDLAILDIMLPGEDGFSLAETMMERAVPVLFLTAKTAVSDRVRGLRMGAFDEGMFGMGKASRLRGCGRAYGAGHEPCPSALTLVRAAVILCG